MSVGIRRYNAVGRRGSMRLTRNDARSGFESSVYQRRPVNGLTRAREEEGKGEERG